MGTTNPHAYFKGRIVPVGEANVSIMTHALQYGTAVFGGIRAYRGTSSDQSYIFRLPDHCKRLMQSARQLGCPTEVDQDGLAAIIRELAAANQPDQDAYIRPYLYVADTGIGPNLAGKSLSLAVYMIRLGDYLPTDKGIDVMVSSWRRIADGAVPSLAKAAGGYINAALARKEASDNGFDEAIMLRENGQVSEGSAENIFLVRDGVLVTPSLSEGILEGITRRSIIQMAKDLGIPCEARPVQRSELYTADEIFLCGTGCQVTWVRSVDTRVVDDGAIGPVSKRIQELFFKIVRGDEPSYSSWLTEVGKRNAPRG